MTEEKKITSVEDYRKNLSKVTEVALPSGALFKMRKLTPIDYIKEGLKDIPNEFFKFIQELSGSEDIPDTEEARKNIEVFDNFLRVTIEKGVVEPLITLRYDDEKKDTHLLFSELTQRDQKFVIDFITGRLTLT